MRANPPHSHPHLQIAGYVFFIENFSLLNRNSTTDRFRPPMRVSHEPVLTTTNVHRSPLSPSTGSQSSTLKVPTSPTKRSLKDFRNDPLPTLQRLPPRKT
jgi:hypothetical protein